VSATESWHDIWERKGRSVQVGHENLATLVALDGYDTGAGHAGPEQLHAIAATVLRELPFRPGMRLLEVGCGAGALLWCLRRSELELAGCDYSASLIEHARAALPGLDLRVADAAALPFADRSFDAVVCNSVFLYFPSHDYARRVLDEFRRVAPVALVMDVPDVATQIAAEEARAKAGSLPATHLYYPRSFFDAEKVWTNELQGYGNAPYRFHARLVFG
jgi:SAM-dependent methyltransferase